MLGGAGELRRAALGVGADETDGAISSTREGVDEAQ